ncbi:RimK-like ATPgrasp N-terminal domain-containing protein [Methanocella conradii]|uniref:RimK-like ATPgrasp N-terminal domain-containing protein n=1 Tax=Methanocella conradii TaxID=1175444 RepID=UPI0024B39B59|nr:RimK-like ATPgrasp N-terminal domain-containing protein [Methanocella conradii]MDI6897801.1 RimK-like ATPgrasp N-terminal domain-containing protein [Methanocella conradii]
MTIVVSEDDEDADYSPFAFLESHVNEDVLNVSHDYRYQKIGYYVSMHAELCGCRVTPRCSDILDTHRNPLLMIRASRAGIPCLPYRLISGYEKDLYPALCFAVNPYTCNSVTKVKSESQMYRTIKSLSVNNRYPVSVQPLLGEVKEAVQVFGETDVPEARAIARKFYEAFRIPVGKLVLQVVDGEAKLCHFEPAAKKEVDWALVRERVHALKGR